MKTYTYQVSGSNDDGYADSEIVTVSAAGEAEADHKAESKSILNGPTIRLISIQ